MVKNSEEVSPEVITLESLLSDEKIRQLKEILDEYPDIVSDYVECEENDIKIFPEDLIKIFTFLNFVGFKIC